MHVKKWVGIAIAIGLFAVVFVWMPGTSQTIGRDLPSSYASSNVPAPGPSQRKVLLKDLGMT